MSAQTTLELGAVEAIKRSHRTIRMAVHTVVRRASQVPIGEGPQPTMEESNQALAVIAAVTPVLEALTGQVPDRQVAAALHRLWADGRIPAVEKPEGAARMIVALAKRT